MHCKTICLDMPFYYSDASNVMIFSKAQWEKEGEAGYETHPAGTGPYIFKERQLTYGSPKFGGKLEITLSSGYE
jgi:hypothetical protein